MQQAHEKAKREFIERETTLADYHAKLLLAGKPQQAKTRTTKSAHP